MEVYKRLLKRVKSREHSTNSFINDAEANDSSLNQNDMGGSDLGLTDNSSWDDNSGSGIYD